MMYNIGVKNHYFIVNRYITLLVFLLFLKVTVTAYHAPCSRCGTRGKTYTGRNASLPGIAVDPKLIPIGSKVKVNGKWYLADDTGPKGKHVDIRIRNSSAAHGKVKHFGKHRMMIAVKKKK
ncbi:MAG: 3D domain-containing protein [Armatimonadota bacterium]